MTWMEMSLHVALLEQVVWAAALEHGARRFLARGVPAHKLVLGVPFYGYAYPCLNSGVTDDVCAIPREAWGGVNCRRAPNTFWLRRGVRERLCLP